MDTPIDSQPKKQNPKSRKWLWRGLVPLSILAVIGLLIPFAIRGETIHNPEVMRIAKLGGPRQFKRFITTYNVAHGWHGSPQSHTDIPRGSQPQTILYQECPQGFSPKSMRIASLALSNKPKIAFNVNGLGMRYGTSVLVGEGHTESLTFPATPPTWPKGFCIVATENPMSGAPLTGLTGRDLELMTEYTTPYGIAIYVSVHLDFLSAGVRHKQARILIDHLKKYRTAHKKPVPMIIGGDFNCEWEPGGVLDTICTELDLHAFDPTNTSDAFITHPLSNRRLDWILIDNQLQFLDYQTGKATHSDHCPVTALVELK